MRRLFPACLLLLAVPALAAPPAPAAQKKQREPLSESRHLWSTVNVCDTRRYPDQIGIRASMPGTGRRKQTMWMRFQVQYRSPSDRRWKRFTAGDTDSGWVKVGHAGYKARQSGYLFDFDPAKGDTYVLRGLVRFQWRRGRRVVHRARELTSAGHHVSFADPKDYSRKRCEIKGPPA
jgi:hypothetical protein